MNKNYSTIAAFSSLYFQHVEPVQESTGWTQSAWTREGRQTWNNTISHYINISNTVNKCFAQHTSCASAPWLPWPPSASGQGSLRTQPQPTWIHLSDNFEGFEPKPVLLSPPPLESEPVPLPLQHHGGDQALHLGCRKLLLLSVLKMFGFSIINVNYFVVKNIFSNMNNWRWHTVQTT